MLNYINSLLVLANGAGGYCGYVEYWNRECTKDIKFFYGEFRIMKGICYNCFQNLLQQNYQCPYCGFPMQSYQSSLRALVPETVRGDRYLVGRTLGEGGFGITYLALDRNTQTRVAIKEYFPGALVTRDVSVYGGNTLHTLSQGSHKDFQAGLKRYVEEASILSKFQDLPGIDAA